MNGKKGCSREELYAQVWFEPMTKVSERFGVSGSYLARICTLLGVPRPERGYWAKLAVGKAPAQPPLPEARPGEPQEWSPDELLQAPPRPAVTAPRGRTRVRTAPTDVHSLVRGARMHFENGRPVKEGAFLKPYKRLLLDLTASKPALENAFELANRLFNAFEAIGHRVVVAPQGAGYLRAQIDEREAPNTKRRIYDQSGLWSPQRPTVVYIGTVAIGLAVVEMSESVLLRYVDGKYIRETDYLASPRRHKSEFTFTTTNAIPSGRMRIVAYSPYGLVEWPNQWQDTDKVSVGSLIPAIIRSVEAMAGELVVRLEAAERQAEVEHQRWLAQMEEHRRAEDRRRVQESEKESRTQLEQVIQQWSNVISVERFLTGVEEHAALLPADQAAMVLERLALARSFLGTQDPLDFFRAWRAPRERYTPVYQEDLARPSD
jgi:hypothetical protein